MKSHVSSNDEFFDDWKGFTMPHQHSRILRVLLEIYGLNLKCVCAIET